ncbi:MAG: hypothetical protein HPY85_06900 [Anaerolineae bacterium]|nr:hypothetical protein [Anaerolineae bacterium]
MTIVSVSNFSGSTAGNVSRSIAVPSDHSRILLGIGLAGATLVTLDYNSVSMGILASNDGSGAGGTSFAALGWLNHQNLPAAGSYNLTANRNAGDGVMVAGCVMKLVQGTQPQAQGADAGSIVFTNLPADAFIIGGMVVRGGGLTPLTGVTQVNLLQIGGTDVVGAWGWARPQQASFTFGWTGTGGATSETIVAAVVQVDGAFGMPLWWF